jgi:hypothetical protein
MRKTPLVTLALVALFAEAGLSQNRSTATSGSSPVALVYVSSLVRSSFSSHYYQIHGFTASASGALTPISGLPLNTSAGDIVATQKYLFATDGTYIYSFAIASDGNLNLVASIDATALSRPDEEGCPNGYVGPLFLDRTGTSLYDSFYCTNASYQSFSIDNDMGALTYLGTVDGSLGQGALSFADDNSFAYGAWVYHFNSAIAAYQRTNDGALSSVFTTPVALFEEMPIAPEGYTYFFYGVATDSTNHLAALVQMTQPPSPPPADPDLSCSETAAFQLASYTAEAAGTLVTNSTYCNMPVTQSAGSMAISPSGKLLAVGGSGLQVFHFNGGNPITAYTGLLTNDYIAQVAWDNDNHLYAISTISNKLHVFTVTPASFREAPGSPYTVTNPQSIAVAALK